MALRFRFTSVHPLSVTTPEDGVRRGPSPLQDADIDTFVNATGFRFGSSLVCVARQSNHALALPALVLTDSASGATRTMNVHTRFVRLGLEEQLPGFDTDDIDLIAMLLNDQEDTDLFPDLATHFVLQAPIGSRVFVRGYTRTTTGQIIDRERLRGNFRYVVSLSNGEEYEGSPVFVGEDLIGVLVRAGPGVATVLGLEPMVSRTSPGSFFAQNRNRTSYREAFQSLLPESRTRHDAIRERLSRMRLFVEDTDFQMT